MERDNRRDRQEEPSRGTFVVDYRGILGTVDSRTFSTNVTTAGLEALGGTVDLTIYSDGSYKAHVHMHDSGFASYTFRLVILFTAGPGAPIGQTLLALDAAGDVEGTDATIPFKHEPNREFYTDLAPVGPSPLLRQYWYAYKNGDLNVSKAYSHQGGLVGAVESFIKDYFIDFASLVFGAAVLGLPPIAGAIYLTSMVMGPSPRRFVGDSGLVGLIAAAGVFILVGPTFMFPVFVTGAVAMELGGPSHRPLHEDEVTFAKRVFNDTIPWKKIIVTDMVGLNGYPFTVPGMDGSIISNLGVGNYFDDLSKGTLAGVVGGDTPGYFFIHELTHAWQIANDSWQSFLCREIGIQIGSIGGSLLNQYRYGSPDSTWDCFNAEQQACIVADWFAGKWYFSAEHALTDPRTAMDPNDSYFPFIAGHIWLGLH